MNRPTSPLHAAFGLACLLMLASPAFAQDGTPPPAGPVVFSAMGCGPYTHDAEKARVADEFLDHVEGAGAEVKGGVPTFRLGQDGWAGQL